MDISRWAIAIISLALVYGCFNAGVSPAEYVAG
jgi:hypothetical protein